MSSPSGPLVGSILSQLATKQVDMKGRRVVSAADAVNPQDYVTLNDLETRLASSAYIDTTNASNIKTGTLSPSVIPFTPTTQTVTSNVVGTVYPNQATTPRLVIVSLQMSVTSGNTSTVQALTDAANPPTTLVSEVSISFTIAGISDTLVMNLIFVVPPGQYYKLVQAAGASITVKWTEWNIG